MTRSLTDLKVLVVDDSKSMRRIVLRFLTSAGVSEIQEAKDGKAALEIMETFPADLLVSDLNMPRMNGLELLTLVREKEENSRLCFVMLTVEAVQKTMNLALKKGADSYIVKPVTESVFISEIKAALDRRRL